MSLLDLSPWASQPQLPVEIDSRWLARGIGSVTTGSVGLYDLGKNQRATITTPTSWSIVSTVAGKANKCATGGPYATFPNGNTSTTGALSLLVVMLDPLGSECQLSSTTATFAALGITTSAGNVIAKTRTSGATTVIATGPAKSSTDLIVAAARWQPSIGLTLWVDGVKYFTSDANTGTGVNANVLSLGGATTNGFILVAAFNGAITDAEGAALTANKAAPWQIFAPLPRRIWVPTTAGGGSTGTVAYTNANDPVAASGTTTIVGTLARTNTNDSVVASGTTTIIGTVAQTNNNDTVIASGSAGNVTGTLAYTNANDSIVASGVVPSVGTLSKTNANDMVVASGTSGSTSTVTIKAGSWLRYRVIQ